MRLQRLIAPTWSGLLQRLIAPTWSGLIICALAGCPDRTISALPPDQVGEVGKDIPVSADIDILFVIDNSGSTADKQAVFARNFGNFVAALDRFETGRPNLHIGVVSSTVEIGAPGFGICSMAPNDNGLMQNTPRTAGCMAPRERFLSDIKRPDGSRLVNYAGTLAEAFSCIATVGTGGCGFESPLEAMKRALDGSRSENAGFLRPGAFLAVVILTDEDDASPKDRAMFMFGEDRVGPGDFRGQPMFAYTCDRAITLTPGSYTGCRPRTDSYLRDPAEYYQFLSTVKPPGRTIVAVIGGDPKPDIATGKIEPPAQFTQELALLPSCTAMLQAMPPPAPRVLSLGRPAIRLADFVSRFADRGLFRSVCQEDYSQTLTDIGQLLFNAVSPCLEGALDTTDVDPANPGTQLDCVVSDIEGAGTGSEVETPMRPCRMTDPTTPTPPADSCYWIKPNPASCRTTTNLEINFVRAAPPSPNTTVRVRCASDP